MIEIHENEDFKEIFVSCEDNKPAVLKLNPNYDMRDLFYKIVYYLPSTSKNMHWEIYADKNFIGFIEKNGLDNPKIRVCVEEFEIESIFCIKKIK